MDKKEWDRDPRPTNPRPSPTFTVPVTVMCQSIEERSHVSGGWYAPRPIILTPRSMILTSPFMKDTVSATSVKLYRGAVSSFGCMHSLAPLPTPLNSKSSPLASTAAWR